MQLNSREAMEAREKASGRDAEPQPDDPITVVPPPPAAAAPAPESEGEREQEAAAQKDLPLVTEGEVFQRDDAPMAALAYNVPSDRDLVPKERRDFWRCSVDKELGPLYYYIDIPAPLAPTAAELKENPRRCAQVKEIIKRYDNVVRGMVKREAKAKAQGRELRKPHKRPAVIPILIKESTKHFSWADRGTKRDHESSSSEEDTDTNTRSPQIGRAHV